MYYIVDGFKRSVYDTMFCNHLGIGAAEKRVVKCLYEFLFFGRFFKLVDIVFYFYIVFFQICQLVIHFHFFKCGIKCQYDRIFVIGEQPPEYAAYNNMLCQRLDGLLQTYRASDHGLEVFMQFIHHFRDFHVCTVLLRQFFLHDGCIQAELFSNF